MKTPGATEVLQKCYNSIPDVLQEYNKSATKAIQVLPKYYKCITGIQRSD